VETGEKELPPGEPGELIVKGPQVMKGYWNRPDETCLALRNGWLYTGDIAVMDADGYFRIVDRKKDMIIAGGYNIYPRDVEEVLYQHPQVLEAAVAGVADAYRGETVKAYVVLKPGQTATADDIIAFCRERLAAYKVPKIVEYQEFMKKYAPKEQIGGFSLSGYCQAMVMVEGLKRAGRNLTRETFMQAMDSMQNYTGSPLPNVTYTPTDHAGVKTAFLQRAQKNQWVTFTNWITVK
jgi:long-subunit acyl-CoA synthetase (AMP-forming)